MFLRSAVDQLCGNSASPPLPLPVPLNPPTGATQQSWESQEDNSLQILKCSNLRAIFWLYCWNGIQTRGQQFGTSVYVMAWLMPKIH